MVRIDSPAGAFRSKEGDLAWSSLLNQRMMDANPRIAVALHASIVVAPSFDGDLHPGDMPRGFVSVWGDIENVGTPDDINTLEAWVFESFDEPEDPLYWIRQGVIHINVDVPYLSHVLLYNASSESWHTLAFQRSQRNGRTEESLLWINPG
jgi:hypothetical protein